MFSVHQQSVYCTPTTDYNNRFYLRRMDYLTIDTHPTLADNVTTSTRKYTDRVE